MAEEKNTAFNYLLNAMELAAQSKSPALAGYGSKRKALIAHVRELERKAALWDAEHKDCLPATPVVPFTMSQFASRADYDEAAAKWRAGREVFVPAGVPESLPPGWSVLQPTEGEIAAVIREGAAAVQAGPAPDARTALEAALPVLQDYASSNPMHFYRGAWQDPRGVHAAVKLVTAALGVAIPGKAQQ